MWYLFYFIIKSNFWFKMFYLAWKQVQQQQQKGKLVVIFIQLNALFDFCMTALTIRSFREAFIYKFYFSLLRKKILNFCRNPFIWHVCKYFLAFLIFYCFARMCPLLCYRNAIFVRDKHEEYGNLATAAKEYSFSTWMTGFLPPALYFELFIISYPHAVSLTA